MIGLLKKPWSACQLGWKEILKHLCVNLLSLLEVQNKKRGTAPQVLLNQGWITSATQANH